MTSGIGAIVLAGGRSTRFGSDKLVADVDGAPLLDHALTAALGIAEQVVLVGPSTYAVPDGVTVVREDPPFSGPYAAVVAGLDALGTSVTSVLVLAGDLLDPAPLLPRLLEALDHVDSHGRTAEAAVALDSEGHRQPLLAAYRVDPLAGGVAGVDPYNRAAYDLLDGLHVVTVHDEGGHSRDVDSPDDLA